jgi:pyruvate formate lyase activating enzyme
MKIKGFQKVTLIDYPGEVACTIFLFGCNFRCGFCHNPELVFEDAGKNIKEFSEKEVLDYLEERKKYLDGICITGGEPLLSLDKDFLKKIKDFGYKIKIDTNGSFPEKLRKFVFEGLVDFVSMDIKSSKKKYFEICNSELDFEKLEESMKIICGLESYEFRTTIVEGIHEVEDVKKIAEWLNNVCGKKPKKFVLQGFKNNEKFIDESFGQKKDASEEFLNEIKNEIKDYFEEVSIRV